MKKIKTLVISALCIMLAMTSCDNKDKSDSSNSIVGSWVWTEGSHSYVFSEHTLTFEQNGTGTCRSVRYDYGEEIYDRTLHFTYRMSSAHKGTLMFEYGEEWLLSIEGGLLYVNDGDDEWPVYPEKDLNPLVNTRWEYDENGSNDENIWFYFTGEDDGYYTEKGKKRYFIYTFDSRTNVITVKIEINGDVEVLEYRTTYLWWESEKTRLVKDGLK